MVNYDDDTQEFLYIKDLLQSQMGYRENNALLMKDLMVMPVSSPVRAQGMQNDFTKLKQAKTPATSLFLHKGQQKNGDNVLVYSQYKPLPAYKVPDDDNTNYDELF